ncbi:MAG: ModD protein, partial [Hafnia sp.]
PDNWQSIIATLRQQAPEKTIIVEADTVDEAKQALLGMPDIVQLDKFSPDDIVALKAYAQRFSPHCRLSLAGGVTLATIDKFAQTGISLLVTSAPYYAPPADIKVRLGPSD